jgi:putative N6-adenine-specific DNA methylase
MHLRGFDKTKWENLRMEASRLTRKNLKKRIIATDINQQATEAARKNAMTAGVEHLIEFRTCDFADTPVPEGSGIVLLNPEYGERMGQMDKLSGTYSA